MNLTGQTLGDYQLQSVIGHGPRATIYRARQMPVDRIVAVKVYDESVDPDQVRSAVESVEALTQANVLPVYGTGAYHGLAWVAMRHMPVGSIRARWRGAAPLNDVARVLPQIAAALDHAHDHGLLHLNLTPSNILLDHPGNAFVADFGIPPQPGSAYAAPEAARGGQLDARADVYSLGAVLYEILTGRAPVARRARGDDRANTRMADLPSPRSIRSDLPVVLEDVVLCAMSIDPDARFATPGALAAAFAQAMDTLSQAEPAPAAKGVPNARWLAFGAAGLALIAVVLVLATASNAPGGAPAVTSPPRSTASIGASETPLPAASSTATRSPAASPTATRPAATATRTPGPAVTQTPTASSTLPARRTATPVFSVVSFALNPMLGGMTGAGQLDVYFDVVVQSSVDGPYGQLFAYLPDIDSLVTERVGAQVYSGAHLLQVTLVVDCAPLGQPFTTNEIVLEIRAADQGPALYATSVPYRATWCR